MDSHKLNRKTLSPGSLSTSSRAREVTTFFFSFLFYFFIQSVAVGYSQTLLRKNERNRSSSPLLLFYSGTLSGSNSLTLLHNRSNEDQWEDTDIHR